MAIRTTGKVGATPTENRAVGARSETLLRPCVLGARVALQRHERRPCSATRRLVALIISAAALAVVGLVGALPASAATSTQPFKPIALGVFVGETDAMGSQVDAFRTLTDATPAVVMWYQG